MRVAALKVERSICPSILEIITLYDQLSNLEMIKDHLTSRSFELLLLTDQPSDLERASPLAADYLSSLKEVQRKLENLYSVGGRIGRKNSRSSRAFL